MRLMLLGTDRSLFTQGSPLSERMARFAGNTHMVDSIIFSTRAHGVLEPRTITSRLHAYPTRSRSRFLYGLDALRIAKTLPRPDIVSAQDPFETGLAALLIARHFGVPFAVEIHTDFSTPAFAQHSLLNRLRLMIAAFVLTRASGGYAVAARVRDAIVKKYNLSQPFDVLPIFIDVTRFRSLPRAPKSGNLLWVGRFASEKNPALALHAFAAARKAQHALHLTMLGDGPVMSELRLLAEHLEIGGHVAFPGWQDPAVYLPTAELVLSTSAYEGYGMAIVEALAAGVPVLATDVGIAREAGATIAEGDYTGALLHWLNGPRKPGMLQLRSYANEEEYFDRVYKLYASLCASRASMRGIHTS